MLGQIREIHAENVSILNLDLYCFRELTSSYHGTRCKDVIKKSASLIASLLIGYMTSLWIGFRYFINNTEIANNWSTSF